jgi:predicted hotdog family 3-hydroxylacyl-ACP dehydratase
MKTDFRTIPVEDLLPHAGDMVLLDRILDYGEGYAVSSVKVTPQSRFYEEALGGIHCAIGLEWMAQTIAAVAGITALSNSRPVKVGFLLGSRRYQPATTVFRNQSEYIVRVEQLYHEDNGLGAIECSIREGDELIAESKLNVFAPDNVDEFLKGEGV